MIDRKHTVAIDTIEDGRMTKYRVRFRMNKKGISKAFDTEKEAKSVESMLFKIFAEMGFLDEDLEPIDFKPQYQGLTDQEQKTLLTDKITRLIASGKLPTEFTGTQGRDYIQNSNRAMWQKYREQIATSRSEGKTTFWKLKEKNHPAGAKS